MKEIVNRLTENRNIERAKSILESNGYVVEKRMDEGTEYKDVLGLETGVCKSNEPKGYMELKKRVDSLGTPSETLVYKSKGAGGSYKYTFYVYDDGGIVGHFAINGRQYPEFLAYDDNFKRALSQAHKVE